MGSGEGGVVTRVVADRTGQRGEPLVALSRAEFLDHARSGSKQSPSKFPMFARTPLRSQTKLPLTTESPNAWGERQQLAASNGS